MRYGACKKNFEKLKHLAEKRGKVPLFWYLSTWTRPSACQRGARFSQEDKCKLGRDGPASEGLEARAAQRACKRQDEAARDASPISYNGLVRSKTRIAEVFGDAGM